MISTKRGVAAVDRPVTAVAGGRGAVGRHSSPDSMASAIRRTRPTIRGAFGSVLADPSWSALRRIISGRQVALYQLLDEVAPVVLRHVGGVFRLHRVGRTYQDFVHCRF